MRKRYIFEVRLSSKKTTIAVECEMKEAISAYFTQANLALGISLFDFESESIKDSCQHLNGVIEFAGTKPAFDEFEQGDFMQELCTYIYSYHRGYFNKVEIVSTTF